MSEPARAAAARFHTQTYADTFEAILGEAA
jgi:hypothetical protein